MGQMGRMGLMGRVESRTTTSVAGRDAAKTAFLGKRAASGYCALSPRTLDYARERGDLPYHKIGTKVVFRISDLDAFMGLHRVALDEDGC
jgi:hypothetical protein